MRRVYFHQTVGEIVAQNPGLAHVFESLGIDYCCRGKTPLIEACHQKGIGPSELLARLREGERRTAQNYVPADVTGLTLAELADHIENTHHAYLREELPRLVRLTRDVASRHGDKDPRLHQVHETLQGMGNELWQHMLKEEQCLFPMIRRLDDSDTSPAVYCATIAHPIRQMESEHDDADVALAQLRELTDDFSPPEWACNAYRALLAALAYLEKDMHSHVHKENNVLFPNALQTEAQRQRGVPVA
jgi:regulator of cell morphogenesis and NO signaling